MIIHGFMLFAMVLSPGLLLMDVLQDNIFFQLSPGVSDGIGILFTAITILYYTTYLKEGDAIRKAFRKKEENFDA